MRHFTIILAVLMGFAVGAAAGSDSSRREADRARHDLERAEANLSAAMRACDEAARDRDQAMLRIGAIQQAMAVEQDAASQASGKLLQIQQSQRNALANLEAAVSAVADARGRIQQVRARQATAQAETLPASQPATQPLVELVTDLNRLQMDLRSAELDAASAESDVTAYQGTCDRLGREAESLSRALATAQSRMERIEGDYRRARMEQSSADARLRLMADSVEQARRSRDHAAEDLRRAIRADEDQRRQDERRKR